MRFIKKWAYKSALQLALSMNENHEKRRVYYFGFEVVIGTLVKLILILLASVILGIFESMLVIILAFSTLRVIAGGYHMDTYGKCFTASMLLFIPAAFISKYLYSLLSIDRLIILIVICFSLAFFILLKWAPADTPNRQITRIEEIKKFKKLAIGYALIWGFVMIVLVIYQHKMYILAGCLGFILEAFMITPAAYKLFERIS